MIWRRWECFLEVGKVLSYSKASKNLYLNQSVVTYHIQNLEDEMGLKLFERSPHSVAFTPAGKELYDKLSPLFQEISDVINAFNRNAAQYELFISSTYMLNYKIFTPVFDEFIMTHANVKVIPKQFEQRAALIALLQDEIEACFAFKEEADEYGDRLGFTPLFSIRRNGILVPASDPLSKKEEVTYNDFKNHTVILPKDASSHPRLSYFCKRVMQLANHIKIEYTDNILSAYSMVSEGKGICPAMDFMPPASSNVTLLYNKEDLPSIAGICTDMDNDSVYVHELVELLKRKYPLD